ncbi:hypothetical protein NEOKW01_0266 [Nematocida sp. AWRm80]|nr:hypothetical protein NEOKW01_0266 [Nematocida sp. AWRm80]
MQFTLTHIFALLSVICALSHIQCTRFRGQNEEDRLSARYSTFSDYIAPFGSLEYMLKEARKRISTLSILFPYLDIKTNSEIQLINMKIYNLKANLDLFVHIVSINTGKKDPLIREYDELSNTTEKTHYYPFWDEKAGPIPISFSKDEQVVETKPSTEPPKIRLAMQKKHKLFTDLSYSKQETFAQLSIKLLLKDLNALIYDMCLKLNEVFRVELLSVIETNNIKLATIIDYPWTQAIIRNLIMHMACTHLSIDSSIISNIATLVSTSTSVNQYQVKESLADFPKYNKGTSMTLFNYWISCLKYIGDNYIYIITQEPKDSVAIANLKPAIEAINNPKDNFIGSFAPAQNLQEVCDVFLIHYALCFDGDSYIYGFFQKNELDRIMVYLGSFTQNIAPIYMMEYKTFINNLIIIVTTANKDSIKNLDKLITEIQKTIKQSSTLPKLYNTFDKSKIMISRIVGNYYLGDEQME